MNIIRNVFFVLFLGAGWLVSPSLKVDAVCNLKGTSTNAADDLVLDNRDYRDIPLIYPAVLEPLSHTLLSTEINVRVTKIYKRMGDCFQKGEPLIQLDDINLRATYQRAIAILQKARCVMATKERLFKSGISSHMDLIDAKAQLGSAEAEATIALKNLTDATILAPYDGRVVLLNVEEDEYPLQEWHIKNKPIMEVINDKILRAKVLIPSTVLRRVQIGDQLIIKVKDTGEEVSGKVTRIGVMMDPVSSTIPIEAEIDNSEGRFLGGMTGAATLKSVNQMEAM